MLPTAEGMDAAVAYLRAFADRDTEGMRALAAHVDQAELLNGLAVIAQGFALSSLGEWPAVDAALSRYQAGRRAELAAGDP